MIDDSEIITYQYFLYDIYRTYDKLKSSFTSYLMFRKYCYRI